MRCGETGTGTAGRIMKQNHCGNSTVVPLKIKEEFPYYISRNLTSWNISKELKAGGLREIHTTHAQSSNYAQ